MENGINKSNNNVFRCHFSGVLAFINKHKSSQSANAQHMENQNADNEL